MAQSFAHRFGQIIGEVLELAILLTLRDFAKMHNLYLDRKGIRPCRTGKKCTWVDSNGNHHDLDFVLERGGTRTKQGIPVAFIESAWRRYTKHSRNKVQEIQGAIDPLAETYRSVRPFKGAILAGVFTAGAITQLESLGYTVLYFSYESVIEAFRVAQIDASSDERTTEAKFREKVAAFENLTQAQKSRMIKKLLKENSASVNAFLESLENSVNRKIERVVVLALHGCQHEARRVDDAIAYLKKYAVSKQPQTIDRFEIEIRFSNGDFIRGNFTDKTSSIQFLLDYKNKNSDS